MTNVVGQQLATPINVFTTNKKDASALIEPGVRFIPDTSGDSADNYALLEVTGTIGFGDTFVPVTGDYSMRIKTLASVSEQLLLYKKSAATKFLKLANDDYVSFGDNFDPSVSSTYEMVITPSAIGAEQYLFSKEGSTLISGSRYVRLQSGDYIQVGGTQAGFNNNEISGHEIVLFEGYIKRNSVTNHELSSNAVPGFSSWWRLQVNSSNKVYYTSVFSGGSTQTATSSGSVGASSTYVKVWYNSSSETVNFNVGGTTNSESHTTQYETSQTGTTYIGRDANSGSTAGDLTFYDFIKMAGTYYSGNYTSAMFDIDAAVVGSTSLLDIDGYGTYNGTITSTTVQQESSTEDTKLSCQILSTGKVRFTINDGTNSRYVDSTTILLADTSYTVTCVTDTLMRLYINGSQEGTTTLTTKSDSATFYVGKNVSLGTDTGFTGNIRYMKFGPTSNPSTYGIETSSSTTVVDDTYIITGTITGSTVLSGDSNMYLTINASDEIEFYLEDINGTAVTLTSSTVLTSDSEYIIRVLNNITDGSELYINNTVEDTDSYIHCDASGDFVVGDYDGATEAFTGRIYDMDFSGNNSMPSSFNGRASSNIQRGVYNFSADYEETDITDSYVSDGTKTGTLANGAVAIDTGGGTNSVFANTMYFKFKLTDTELPTAGLDIFTMKFKVVDDSSAEIELTQTFKITDVTAPDANGQQTFELGWTVMGSASETTYSQGKVDGTYVATDGAMGSFTYNTTDHSEIAVALKYTGTGDALTAFDNYGNSIDVPKGSTYCLPNKVNDIEINDDIEFFNIVCSSQTLSDADLEAIASTGVLISDTTKALNINNSEVFYFVDYTIYTLDNIGTAGATFNLVSALIILEDETVDDAILLASSGGNEYEFTYTGGKQLYAYLEADTTGFWGPNDATLYGSLNEVVSVYNKYIYYPDSGFLSFPGADASGTNTLYVYSDIDDNTLRLTKYIITERRAYTSDLTTVGYTYVDNTSYSKVAVVRDYINCDFQRSWQTVGTFTININADNENTQYLQIGNYIWIGDWIVNPDDSSNGIGEARQGLILYKRRQLTNVNGKVVNNITIRGIELKGLANYTITMPPGGTLLPTGEIEAGADAYDVYSETASEEIMAQLIIKNRSENSVLPFHNIINFSMLYNDTAPRGTVIDAEYRFKKLSTALSELSILSGLGWGAYLPFGSDNIISFFIKEGRDLTETEVIRYSTGQLSGLELVEDGITQTNQMIGAGQGEGILRTVVAVGDFDQLGVDSKLDFVDARDLSTLTGVLNRTEEKLSDRNEIGSLKVKGFSKIIASQMDKAYGLGDTIRVNVEEWGLTADYQIISVRERFFPNNQGTVEIVFGSGNIDVYDNIKYSMSNFVPESTK